MSSSEATSNESHVLQEQSLTCQNFPNNCTFKQNTSSGGTLQDTLSNLCVSRDSLEPNTGNFYEPWTCGSNFGGTFVLSEMDGSFFGGNLLSRSFDDAQVVPDFSDMLETCPVDTVKKDVLSACLVVESANSTQVRQFENSDFSSPRRSNSERDELEVYLPCVLTPIPVDCLYSTLDEDSTIFTFPANSDDMFPHDKSRELPPGEHDDKRLTVSPRGRHSLDSFANLSVFSFPGGNKQKHDVSSMQLERTSDPLPQREVSSGWTSSRKQDRDAGEEGNCSLDIEPQCLLKEQVVSVENIASGENLQSQDLLRNRFCPGALRFGSREDNCKAKAFVPKISCQTVFNTLIQLNPAPASLQYQKFDTNWSMKFEPPLPSIFVDGWTNHSGYIHETPSQKPVLDEEGRYEGDRPSFQTTSTGFVDDTSGGPQNSRIPNPSESYLTAKSKQILTESDTDETKTGQTENLGSNSVNNSMLLTTLTRRERMKVRTKSKPMLSSCCDNSKSFHNDMEKQRRVNMKTRFQNLRQVVPDLCDKEKSSKITILQKAIDFISMLETESVELENLKDSERLRNIELLGKLQKITAEKCLQ